MTNADINKARRLNRVVEQSEKDEVFQRLVSAYGDALFLINDLKGEIAYLRKLYESRKEGNKP